MTNPLLTAEEQAQIDTLRGVGFPMLKQRIVNIDYWRWFKVAAAVLNLAGFTYLLGIFITYAENFGWHSINSVGLLLMGIYHLHAVWTMESDDGIKTLLHSTGMYILVIAY